MTSLRNIIHRTLVLSALFGFAAVTASWAQERLDRAPAGCRWIPVALPPLMPVSII
jgi:hypothetical protein